MYKQVITLLFTFLLFAAIKTNAQVQGGSFFVDKNTKGFTFDQNEGKREVTMEIQFKKPFDVKPVVLTSFSLIDMGGEKFDIPANSSTTIETRDQKIAVSASGISRDGFVLKISVWGSTKINALGGTWMAFTE